MSIEEEGQEEVGGEDAFVDQAREMGWVPKDQFQGPEEKWREPKDFVERGEHILPILRANNKKLRAELLTRDQNIAKLQVAVESAEKGIKALQKTYTETTKLQVEQAKKELREQLKNAREVGDVDTELALTEKMDDLRQAERTSKAGGEEEGKTPEAATAQPTLDPAFVSWNRDNPWFGNMTDPDDRKRTRQVVRIGEDLKDEGDETHGRVFLDKCVKILKDRESGKSRGTSKVENSSPGERRTSSVSFASLPKDARDACHADNHAFVGPGKMFKVQKDWEDHYTKLYNSEG